MGTASSPYDWVREIQPELKALDEIPLTGAAPRFPWDQLSARLCQSFEKKSLAVTPGEMRWRTKEQLYEGLGEALIPLVFAFPSLKGSVCWVMPQQEMAALESLLLTKESHPISFQDSALSEAFYRFLALEVLYSISQINFDKTITPILTKQTDLPNEDSLCWDISIAIDKQILWGRLILSPDFRRSWVDYFAKQGPSPLSKDLAKKVEVLLHLEAGKTELSFQEWSHLAVGDFVLLDTCTLDLDDVNSGRLMMTLNGKPAFRAKIKEGQIKILEFPLYHEVEEPMAKETEDENDDFSDLDEDVDHQDFELDEDLDLNDDEDFFETSELEKPLEAPLPTPRKEEPPVAESAPESKTASRPFSPTNIPVSLVVEVGRIQMTMEKFLSLEPGNLLDLHIYPQEGVNLVINGKIIGKGELVKMGETLGIRILDLGQQ